MENGSGSAVVALRGVMIATTGDNARTMPRREQLWGMDGVAAA
jgi:hypothetical protein